MIELLEQLKPETFGFFLLCVLAGGSQAKVAKWLSMTPEEVSEYARAKGLEAVWEFSRQRSPSETVTALLQHIHALGSIRMQLQVDKQLQMLIQDLTLLRDRLFELSRSAASLIFKSGLAIPKLSRAFYIAYFNALEEATLQVWAKNVSSRYRYRFLERRSMELVGADGPRLLAISGKLVDRLLPKFLRRRPKNLRDFCSQVLANLCEANLLDRFSAQAYVSTLLVWFTPQSVRAFAESQLSLAPYIAEITVHLNLSNSTLLDEGIQNLQTLIRSAATTIHAFNRFLAGSGKSLAAVTRTTCERARARLYQSQAQAQAQTSKAESQILLAESQLDSAIVDSQAQALAARMQSECAKNSAKKLSCPSPADVDAFSAILLGEQSQRSDSENK